MKGLKRPLKGLLTARTSIALSSEPLSCQAVVSSIVPSAVATSESNANQLR